MFLDQFLDGEIGIPPASEPTDDVALPPISDVEVVASSVIVCAPEYRVDETCRRGNRSARSRNRKLNIG